MASGFLYYAIARIIFVFIFDEPSKAFSFQFWSKRFKLEGFNYPSPSPAELIVKIRGLAELGFISHVLKNNFSCMMSRYSNLQLCIIR